MIADVVPFLANILLLAHADGKLSAAESGQLEAIRKEMKFKKSDYSEAVRLVEQGEYKLSLVGSFADQVKNLELMLQVAYADAHLDKREASLIRDYCKSIGIKQDQLNRLQKEVLVSLNQQGNFDTDIKGIQVHFEIPTRGLAIEFAESTAASFPKAMSIAKSLEGYQDCLKAKKKWHLAVYPSGHILEALPLAECLNGLRNRSVYIDGNAENWEEVFGFVRCASERTNAYRPVEYCFGKDENRLNPWGCKQAQMDWTGWADWFCCGKWEKLSPLGKEFQWRFDKKRIKHQLNSNLHRFRFCPHLETALSEAVLKQFPETVTPSSDPNWNFKKRHEEVPGAIRIVVKERSDGYVYAEFWSNGVYPQGHKVLEQVFTAAFDEIKMKTISPKELLE